MKKKIDPAAVLLLLTGALCIVFLLIAGIRTCRQIQETEQDLETAAKGIEEKQQSLRHAEEVFAKAIDDRKQYLNWQEQKAINARNKRKRERERDPSVEEEEIKPSVFSRQDNEDPFTDSPEIIPESTSNGHIVGIDPGHQSYAVDMSAQEPLGPGSSEMKAKCTTGTQGSYTGIPEYQLNLEVSLKLRDELARRGYQTVMTRTDNETAISNKERAELAASQGSEIYVRIHANGDDSHTASGALTMAPSPQNPYVAGLSDASVRLSQCILDSYCAATGFQSLGVQYYDNMTGINWSTIPVTILEMGFMTHEYDDRQMNDTAFQDTMVQGIANGIDAYFAQQ